MSFFVCPPTSCILGSLWMQLQPDWMPALSLLSALSSLNKFLSARFMHACCSGAALSLSCRRKRTLAYSPSLAHPYSCSFVLSLCMYERNTFLCFAACGDWVHSVSTQTNAGSSARVRFDAEKRKQRPNIYENSEIFDRQRIRNIFF